MKCISCGAIQPGTGKTCAKCLERIGKWRRGNPDKVRAANRAWYQRSETRFKRHGITKELYDEMLTSQDGKCAICGNAAEHENDMSKSTQPTLQIDHCHKTKKVRGLLCGQCNTAIGKFKDNPDLLVRAFAYLMGVGHESSRRFYEKLSLIGKLHAKKQADYGAPGDPFSNVRASEDFGVPGWVGCMMRANDKMKRVQTFAKRGSLENEGVKDSLMDLAVYSLIGLVLYEETAHA